MEVNRLDQSAPGRLDDTDVFSDEVTDGSPRRILDAIRRTDNAWVRRDGLEVLLRERLDDRVADINLRLGATSNQPLQCFQTVDLNREWFVVHWG